jgi:hypothetical protein
MAHSFVEIIDKFGGPAAFAREVGMTAGAAKQAKRRGSIGSRWFAPTVQAAERCGFDDITYERLSELAASREAA